MDKQKNSAPNVTRELELEILLHINKQIFEKGRITTEIYEKAKERILKL